MAEADRTMKTGDTYPPLIRVLEDDLGPIDLPLDATVRIIARKDVGTVIAEDVTIMTIEDAIATGFLRGDWSGTDLVKRAAVMWDINLGDTAISGAYPFEFEITWTPDDIETIPNERANNPTLQIDEDLD